MIYKYYYSCKADPSLLRILEQYSVKYEPLEKIGDDKIFLSDEISFSITSKNKSCSLIRDEAEKSKTFLTVLYEYEPHELSQSEWLVVRSSCYKLDEYEKKNDTYVYDCRWKSTYWEHTNHRRQVAPFRLAKPVKWGKNHFFYSPVGFFEDLFVNDYARNVLEKNEIRGIEYWPVRLRGRDDYVADIYQMKAVKTLPNEALDLSLEGVRSIACPNCGKVQYALEDDNISLKVRKEYLTDDVDFCVTDSIFGEILAHNKVIVSQRFYQTVCNAKIDRNLFFVPVTPV